MWRIADFQQKSAIRHTQDVNAALLEIRRVLKLEDELLFAEHGCAPDSDVVLWQNRITPIWKRIGGGCHLNRKVDDLIQAAGFRLERLSAGYQKFPPRPFSFFYEGVARPV